MRRHLVNTFVCLSTAVAILITILWIDSYFARPSVFWSSNATLYEVASARGTLVCQRLHQYQNKTPLNCIINKPETRKDFEFFKTLPWWHGRNAWWERIGHTVRSRTQFAGFRFASGSYSPPFNWQHPIMPFTLIQIPYWACLAATALAPTLWLAKHIKHQRRDANRSSPHPA